MFGEISFVDTRIDFALFYMYNVEKIQELLNEGGKRK
jgi:hypothetical protein